MKKIIKWIVIVVVALFVIGLIFGSDDAETTTTTANTSSEAIAEAPTETAIPVTAQEIFEAYDNNEMGADQQYKGKALLVSGTVSGISSDFMDDAQVQLATSNEFMDVMASGDEAFNSAAATLSKGQQITMLCQGGGEVIGSPMLSDCVIQ